MINTLIKLLQIDICYSTNSFIYLFKKLPIIEDLFTDEAYNSKLVKIVIGFIQIITTIFKTTLTKGLYFFLIYIFVSINEKSFIPSFIHTFFFLTILGMFINNKLLRTSKKKYYALILFNIDEDKVLKSNLLGNILTNLIYNLIFIYIFTNNIYYTILLSIFALSARLIGETLNIIFFRKYKYPIYSNSKILLPIIFIFFIISILPCFNIIINWNIILIISIIIAILGLISLIYLVKIKDYKLIYKMISSKTEAMNSDSQDAYIKQSMLEVREKDKIIDKSIIDKKEGYDLFNTIFYQRHKEILLRSAKKYSIIAFIIYLIVIIIMIKYPNYNNSIAELLHLKLSVFVIIMFYFNRGEIVTRAMFYNCDHAMLSYNFYREPKVILELFKKRLITLVKVNLIPALVIGLGNVTLLLISSNSYNIITIITTFLFIICLSIFFSVHYLVIYYILQPYNKNMQVKKPIYTVVTLLTYVGTYRLADFIISSEILSSIGILFTILYTFIALILVYKVSNKTFKLN